MGVQEFSVFSFSLKMNGCLFLGFTLGMCGFIEDRSDWLCPKTNTSIGL